MINFWSIFESILGMLGGKPKEQTLAKVLPFKKREPVLPLDDSRHINQAGLELLKQSEGLRLKAYRDAVNVLTIGYGHTGPDVLEGQVITDQEAENLMRRDLLIFEAGVTDAVDVTINDNQFSALVVFSYNVGVKALRDSTLLKFLNAGDSSAAALQFGRWNKAGGRVLAGLTIRRQKEMELFNA